MTTLITPRDQRLACCYHESGHALIGVLIGFDVSKAHLYRPTGLSGQTLLATRPTTEGDIRDPGVRKAFNDYALYVAAGYAAERLFFERILAVSRPPEYDTDSEDLEHLEEVAGAFVGDDDSKIEEFIRERQNRAFDMLSQVDQFPVLQKLAATLDEHWQVERASIDAIRSEYAELVGSASDATPK